MNKSSQLLCVLAVLSLFGCASIEPDPILARLERSANNAKPLPTPARRMKPSEIYPDNPQAQALVKAAISGDLREIDRLVDAGADPNAVGTYGITLPGWVLYHPDKAGFRRLLERGANPNRIWYDNNRPQGSLLHLATERSPEIGVDYLRMCLEIGKGDPNLKLSDKSYDVLSTAAKPGREAAFAMLYRAGARTDVSGVTRAAVLSNNFKLAFYLLEHGLFTFGVNQRDDKFIYDIVQMSLEVDTISRYPSVAPQYMWFWRTVDWLEKHGVVFDYTPKRGNEPAVRPAVLDTTPPDILGPEAK